MDISSAIVTSPHQSSGGVGRYIRWLANITDSDVFSHDADKEWFSKTNVNVRSGPHTNGFFSVLDGTRTRLKYSYWEPPEELDLLITTTYKTRGVVPRPGQKRIHLAHGIHRGSLGLPTGDTFSDLTIVKFLQMLNRAWIRSYDDTNLSMADQIVVNSKFISELYKKYYNIGSTTVISPPVDLSSYCSPEPEKRENYFLYIGRLDQAKEVDIIVDAFETIEAPLRIAGKGNLEELVKESERKNENITYLGYVTESKKQRLLSHSTGFINHTIAEPFGITTVEALASGTPVVAVNEGNNPNMITDGKNGILFGKYPSRNGFYRSESSKPLVNAVKRSRSTEWNHSEIRGSAKKYDIQYSKRDWVSVLDEVSAYTKNG